MRGGSKRMAVLVTAVVVGGVGAGLNRAQNPAAPPDCTRVAVVDVVKVFNEFEQIKALNQKMAEYRAKRIEEGNEREAELNRIKRELDEVFAPDSAEWAARNKEFTKKKIEFRVWQEVEAERGLEIHKRWLKEIYQMIVDEAGRVAKARGIQLVLTREELDEDADDIKMLLRQIFNRKVIYADQTLDLSDEVLRNLNDAFEKKGGAKLLEFDK